MNKWSFTKLSILIVFIIMLIILAIALLYQWIFQDQWRVENKAIQRAIEQTDLVRSTDAEPFSLEQSFIIVYGQDEEGRNMIVWVGEEEIHAQYTSDGVTKQEIQQTLMEKQPNAQVVRITPGKYHQEWVWEVHYKKEVEHGTRTYYDYYRFSDGEWLETYTMSLK